MPQPGSITKVGDLVVRFKTAKFGVAVFRQRFTDRGVEKYAKGFYLSKTVHGKTARFPLGHDMRTAEKLAEEITGFLSVQTNTLPAAIEKYNPRQLARSNKYATFNEVLDSYHGALTIIGRKGKAVSAGAFKDYKRFLISMIRKVEAYREGTEIDNFNGQHNVDYSRWLNQSTEILTTRFAMDFKLSITPPIPKGETEPDPDELLTAQITADTTLRNARALFSKQALRYFGEIGLKLPDLTGFMSETEFGAKKYFQVLPPEVIAKIMRESIELRISDVDAYRAFLLCMHCGLRRGEAQAFQLSWLRDEDRPTLCVTVDGAFNPKHGHGRKATIETWVAEQLKEIGPIQSADAIDRLVQWVKNIIPEKHAVGKPLHELRKCWVSFKAKTEGILAASQQAGHRDTKTTTTHYADSMMSDKLVPFWKEPKVA